MTDSPSPRKVILSCRHDRELPEELRDPKVGDPLSCPRCPPVNKDTEDGPIRDMPAIRRVIEYRGRPKPTYDPLATKKRRRHV